MYRSSTWPSIAGEHVTGLVDAEFGEDHRELVLQHGQHVRVDRRLEHEVVSGDVMGLADPVDASDALLDARGAPWKVVVD